jgi:hypothetical protein
MAWISFIFLLTSLSAKELPQFLTKHSSESLRYINMDGRYAYLQRKPGVLTYVNNFKSVDFLTGASNDDFLIKGSRSKNRLIIEAIPNSHDELNLMKNHRIFVVDFGNTKAREVGPGRGARLHLDDEWISYYNMIDKVVHIQNLLTQKKYEIKLTKKPHPFFIPDVEMINQRSVVYTEINETGYSALVTFDLLEKKTAINYKSSQTGTRLELCQGEGYLGIGEFPYEGVSRNSKISFINTSDVMNLAGTTGLYSSAGPDIGNMLCTSGAIYFVKTISHDQRLNLRTTEAVRLDLKTQNLEVRSDLKNVSQLIEMDGRVLIPFRGKLFVVEGSSNLGEDVLKPKPGQEELEIDI